MRSLLSLVMVWSVGCSTNSTRPMPTSARPLAEIPADPHAPMLGAERRLAEFRTRNRSANRLMITVGRTCVCGSTDYDIRGEALKGFFDALEFSELLGGHTESYGDIQILSYRGKELLGRNKLHNVELFSLSDQDVWLTRASSVKIQTWFEANQIVLRESESDCIGDPCADTNMDLCVDAVP